MKAAVYNQEGKEMEALELSEEMFGVSWNPDLVHQVAVSQMGNRRQVLAHTKHRGEVSGGGKKPYAQKGTGRSRQGSIRSPLWRHGGVVFGPRNTRVFTQKINDKMRIKALFSVLSEKAKHNALVVLDTLSLEHPKTKIVKELFSKLPVKSESIVLVLSLKEKAMVKAAQNLAKVRVRFASDSNVLELLSAKFIVITREGMKELEQTFVK